MIDVVSMLPEIAGQQCCIALGDRCGCIAGIHNIKAAVCLFDKPRPRRTEVTDRAFGEGFLKRSKASPFLVDSSS